MKLWSPLEIADLFHAWKMPASHRFVEQSDHEEAAAELKIGVELLGRAFGYVPYSHKSLRDDIQKFLCGYPTPSDTE